MVTSMVDGYMDAIGVAGYGNEQAPGFPWKICATVICYLIFVLKTGPDLMRDKKAYQIEGTMRLYNMVNIVVNLALFTTGLYAMNWSSRCYQCLSIPEMAKDTPSWTFTLLGTGYLYLKIFDLLDTIFFVIRKKNSQITVLHVVHHSVMPLAAFIGIKFNPYSSSANVTILNSFVHVIMYTYYLLASYPYLQKYLWWKKYITALQLVQFFILLGQAVFMLTAHAHSPCSKFFSILQITEASYFVYGFGTFYINSYLKPKIYDKSK
ncbi:Elongation of very long chain fatty acids protein 4 [Halotydeus destructor]|nr:Elongation of very long chain fatty acids protein 4 [Halotydeus destructor]